MFSEREMHSRYEIGLEQYVNSVSVEAKITLEVGSTMVLPAGMRFQTEVAQNLAALKAAGVEGDTATLDAVSVRPFPNLPRVGDCLRISVGPWPMLDRCLKTLGAVLKQGGTA